LFVTSPKDRFSLAGRTALITGAASGLGEHFAGVLATAGARVVCAARRVERIEAVARNIVNHGGEALACAIDVERRDSVVAAFDAIDRQFGCIDVLINCAGQATLGSFTELTEVQWMTGVNVNVNGVWRTSQEMVKRLVAAKRGGAIVNIASIVGLLGKPMFANYGATKAALLQLTRNMALDLLQHGIRVNALAPGYFASEMTSWYFETEAGKREIESLPAQRLGRLDELDGPLLLLASDAGSYVNGAYLTVDFGHSARLS
jgi:NAD(P)-dependent dehydrogenase (short-subunit alcohol dehydrogenase family)